MWVWEGDVFVLILAKVGNVGGGLEGCVGRCEMDVGERMDIK